MVQVPDRQPSWTFRLGRLEIRWEAGKVPLLLPNVDEWYMSGL